MRVRHSQLRQTGRVPAHGRGSATAQCEDDGYSGRVRAVQANASAPFVVLCLGATDLLCYRCSPEAA